MHEDIILKIQRMAREKSGELQKESVTTDVKLNEKRKKKELKELKLFSIAQDEAKRLEAERVEKERVKLAEKQNKATAFEITRFNPKEMPTPHGYLGEFTVETKLMPDRRARFTFPKKIKAKLKAGQKVRLEIKLFFLKKAKKPTAANAQMLFLITAPTRSVRI